MSDGENRILDSIYVALDRGDASAALEIARSALAEDDDPVLHFLAGIALLELDRPEQAEVELRRAVELDAEDPEFRANLALALFASCHFDEAEREARCALEKDETLPDAHHSLALVLERFGRFDEADRAFRRAGELDPDAFRAPLRLSGRDFEAYVAAAADRLPESFRRQLDDVVVTVEPLPSRGLLLDDPVPLDPELFGLFVGVPLTARSSFSPGGELPPRILLFQRNLERCFPQRERLIDEITRTLYHELGHYLGMDEDELEESGMG
jgi:predicted Zn-dependent protease with MMP-like domain